VELLVKTVTIQVTAVDNYGISLFNFLHPYKWPCPGSTSVIMAAVLT